MTKSVIRAFSTGEISPELASSSDSEKIRAGLVKCENMIVDALGGVKNRPGTAHVTGAYDSTKQSRILPFQFNTEQAYMLELNDSVMRVLKDGGLVLKDLVDSAYKWTLSGSGTSEYYIELAAGGDPGLLEPTQVLEDSTKMTKATVGSLSAGEWDYGDNDTLGYSTPYVRLSDSTDPDTKSQGYVQAPALITSSYPIADVADLKYTQSADVLYLFHSDYKIRKVTRTSDSDWTMTAFPNIDGPYKSRVAGDEEVRINVAFISGVIWEFTASSAIFGDVEVGEPIRLGFPVPGDLTALHWSWFVVSTVTSSTVIRADLQGDDRIVYQQLTNPFFKTGTDFWQDYSTPLIPPFASNLSYDATNQLAILTDGAGGNAKMEQVVLTFPNVKHRLVVDINAVIGTSPRVTVNVGTTSLGTDISTTLYTSIGVKSITILPTAENIYISFDTVGSTDGDIVKIAKVELFPIGDEPTGGTEFNTTDWRLAAWNSTHGYPEHGIIKDQRLICAGNFAEPQTIWALELGNFESGAFNTPTRSTDAFSFAPSTPQINGIDWLVEQNGLNIGTSSGVWKVFSTTDGAITPTDVNIKIDSAVSTLDLGPIIAGNSIITTPRGLTAVSEITSSLEAQGFAPRDISVLAQHLFEDRRIVSWAYAQEPDSIIWCILDDGQLLGLTYLKEYDIWAWHKHTRSSTLIEFKDVAVVPNTNNDNVDDVYFVIKRNRLTTLESEYYSIEKLHQRIVSQTAAFGNSGSGSPYDYRLLDSALILDDPKAITNISKATPTVITSTAHGFSDGDDIRIQQVYSTDSSIEAAFNNVVFEVSDKTANTFQIKDSEGAYVGVPSGSFIISGGEARKMVTTISGLDHIPDGRKISVLADGWVETDLTVTSGEVTLADPASFVIAGFPYVSEIETIDLELMFEGGTTQGRKKSLTKADVFFKDTRGAEISATSNPLIIRAISFDDEATGEDPPDLLTGSKEITLTGHYRKNERIRIRQTEPLPIHIKRIVPDVDYGG
jgi:hypothetical protein